jgi:hypothetical protein
MKKLICTLIVVMSLIASGSALAGGPASFNGSAVLINEDSFKLSKAEQTFFSQVVSGLPGDNGIFTNTVGVSAYLPAEEEALSFYWTGAKQSVRVFDGQTRNMINGTGEMTVKFADDNLILQRYKGSVQNGLRHGHGELLAREAYHYNAFYYVGNFVHGRMEGRGVYINNDLLDRGGVPFIYEGEFMDDTFHGQGVMTDLNTGEVIHSGLWLEGFPFDGNLKAWERENKKVEVLYAQRRYNDPRIMSQVELAEGKVKELETAQSAGANK